MADILQYSLRLQAWIDERDLPDWQSREFPIRVSILFYDWLVVPRC